MNTRLIDVYVDVSGSMAGHKIQAVNRHLALLFAEIGSLATDVHLYAFAESTQRHRFSKSPNFKALRESTSFCALGDFVSSLQKASKNGSVMFIYSDSLSVNVEEEEQIERISQQFQAAYPIRIGILVSHSKRQDGLVRSICNAGTFGIDEDTGVVAASLFSSCRDAEKHESQIIETKG